MWIEALLLQAAILQNPSTLPVPKVEPPNPDTAGQSPLTGPPPASPPGPSVSSVNARDLGAAAVPPSPPPVVFVRREAVSCADFSPAPGGGWLAAANVQVPGPRGPVPLTQGQAVQPGDYIGGMDLGSMLQRDCPRTPVGARPPTG